MLAAAAVVALAFAPGLAPMHLGATSARAVIRIAMEEPPPALELDAEKKDADGWYNAGTERPDDPTLSCYPDPAPESEEWICADDAAVRVPQGDGDDGF